MTSVEATRNIVIVGGGFAGCATARALQASLRSPFRLVMISEESYTTFNPLLAEVVGASIFPEQVVAPLRQVIEFSMGSRFIMGKVSAIDQDASQIVCESLAGELRVPYDELVLAFGNRPRLDLIPGMDRHALPLKTIGDALEIRNTVLRRLARIELETDPTVRRVLGSFVIIGGGFSGVEVAGELIDCLLNIRRYYPRVAREEIRVTLIHDSDRLLPELPPALGAAARKSLEARGVDVVLATRAVEVGADGVRCTSGSRVQAATVVCTIGTRPNALAEECGLPCERGRIIVEPDLSVAGSRNIWAVGDCARVTNAHDGRTAPPTAQFAVQEAKTLALNIMRRQNGVPTEAFRYRSRGMIASIGHRKGVAAIFGLKFKGIPAWLAWRAYYLSQMPTPGRKLRIFVEWTWGLFFSADITHLRFSRSQDTGKPQ